MSRIPDDDQIAELVEVEQHDGYMRAVIDLLDDSELVEPLLVFSTGDECVVIAPDWIENTEIVGKLTEAAHVQTLEHYGLFEE